MKKTQEKKKRKETNTTKEDFMILMYVTMRVVRLGTERQTLKYD